MPLTGNVAERRWHVGELRKDAQRDEARKMLPDGERSKLRGGPALRLEVPIALIHPPNA